MKKKFAIGILAAVMAGVMLWGCGKEHEAEPVQEDAAEESGEENREEEEEPESGAEPEEAAEPENETEPEASSVEEPDWLEENGLHITPQGELTFSYSASGPEGILGTESAAANITITETIEDGWRKTEAVLTSDFSGFQQYESDGASGLIPGIFCFDRYTGAVNTIWSYYDMYEMWESRVKEDRNWMGCCVESIGSLADGDLKGFKITVLCPEEYDGTVFGVQCISSVEENMLYHSLEESYPIGQGQVLDPETDIHEDCVFFTASDH